MMTGSLKTECCCCSYTVARTYGQDTVGTGVALNTTGVGHSHSYHLGGSLPSLAVLH